MTTLGMFAFMATLIFLKQAAKFEHSGKPMGIAAACFAVSVLWGAAYAAAWFTRLTLP